MRFTTRASRTKRSTISGEVASWLCSTLTAALRPSTRCSAV